MEKRTIAQVLSLVGVGFCLLASTVGTGPLCFTSGCELYKNAIFLGLSFYHFGLVAFWVAFALTFSWKWFTRFALLFLALDIPFLVVQVLTTPCSNCLIVAVLIGALAITAGYQHHWRKAVIAVWLLVFINAGSMALIQKVQQPWAIYETGTDVEMKVFFSPSCQSCKEVLTQLVETDAKESIALYPVGHNPGDVEQICKLENELKSGVPMGKAVRNCFTEIAQQNDIGLIEKIETEAQMFRNKAFLKKAGVNSIPLLQSKSFTVVERKQPKDFDSLFGSESKEMQGCSFDKPCGS